MQRKSQISAELLSALGSAKPLSLDLYTRVLAHHEIALRASLDKDADDALLCMLTDEGQVAMLLIDWEGRVHRNVDALHALHTMWRDNFAVNAQTIVPVLSEHISQMNLGVVGIKWMPIRGGTCAPRPR